MGTKRSATDVSVNTDETDVPVTSDETPETDNSVETVVSDEVDFSDSSGVQAIYGESDQSGKARIRADLRKLIESTQRAAMDAILTDPANAANVATEANRLNALLGTLRTTPAKSTKEVDFGRIVATRLVSVRIANDRLMSGDVLGLPEGVELDIEDIRNTADAMLEAYYKGEADNADEILKTVESFTTVKAGKADKGDLTVHLTEWVSSTPSGTFKTIREIAKFKSSEYPNGAPSDGAIANRIFPAKGECTIPGLVPVEATGTRPRGARVE